MAIPESFLQELVEKNDIVDVVGEYVRLTKRSGSNQFGLCPFHSEKTPSFSVSPDRQIYHCFGCGKGGGVINFIMEIENLSFPEAVEFLAKRVGMTMPEQEDNREAKKRRRLLDLNRDAARFFYSCLSKTEGKPAKIYTYTAKNSVQHASSFAKPKVLIPVFPGTNCEYDTARVFERAGAVPEIVVIKNLSAQTLEESVKYFEKAVKKSQIVMIPGGFSGGDEPDGSGKFITAFFRNPRIKDAVTELLDNRDGLMLGICNGFQALIKLGLVPYGKIVDMTDDSPTLTFNTIARHQSMMVSTRIASTKSPWLAGCEVGDIHKIAISHGEGRFVASPELIKSLADNGQIATQYVDLEGAPSMDIRFNPNSSFDAIEGITSPDGRVLGKMGHSERIGTDICKNVPGSKDQKIFESGVAYFK